MNPSPVIFGEGSRQRVRPPFLLCLLCGMLLGGFLLPLFAAEAPVTPQHRKLELKQLRQRIRDLQSKIKKTQGQQSRLNRQLQESEQRIDRLARGLRVLAGRVNRKTDHLQQLQRQARQERHALEKEQHLLAQQVRAAYAMGHQEQLQILLNQDDLARVSRILAYYDYLNRERVRRMSLIRDRLAALTHTRREITAEREHLVAIQKEQKAQKQALESQQETRRRVLRQLASEIQGQDERLAQLRQNEKQLSRLLQGLQRALADIPPEVTEKKPFAKARGRLRWPVKGVIRHAFGEAKIGKLRWDGVMISTPEGREIKAVYAGRVAFADWLRGFGLLVIIDHGGGYMTLYGHNQSLFKEAGDWVEAGEPIATAGSTGGHKQSGVYFAIRRHGKAIDPSRWCRHVRGRSVG